MKKRYLALAVLAGPVFWFANYWQASNSEGFKYVRSKVMSSQEVASKVGKLDVVRLARLGRFSAHYGETYTRVHMDLEALGSNGTCDLEVNAEKNDEGVWKVKSASMQGNPVHLE
jgi:hypothetical protein